MVCRLRGEWALAIETYRSGGDVLTNPFRAQNTTRASVRWQKTSSRLACLLEVTIVYTYILGLITRMYSLRTGLGSSAGLCQAVVAPWSPARVRALLKCYIATYAHPTSHHQYPATSSTLPSPFRPLTDRLPSPLVPSLRDRGAPKPSPRVPSF